MSLSKSNIIKNITIKSHITVLQGSKILESFLLLIKIKALSKSVKLSDFGTFSFKKSPQRIGRNPKNLESYIIPEINKLKFKPSKKIKEKIN